MSNLSQFASGVPLWVTGTTYALGNRVVSATDWQEYVRIVAGAGATDPSADTTNWRASGARPIKSIQRGQIIIGAAVSNATATITAVVVAKTELRFLGTVDATTSTDNQGLGMASLTNTTTITATRQTGSGVTYVNWELTEYY